MAANDVKAKVTHIVSDYERFLQSDYDAYLQYKKKKEPLNKFSEFEGVDLLDRHLIDYPEMLYTILLKTLLKDEWKWFTTKTGQRWFAKTFRQYAVPEIL